jgi:hypothetical protein
VDEASLEDLEQQRDRLYPELAAAGDFGRGSISENYCRCGKPNCVCAQPDHPGHGPSYLWTRAVAGRSTRGRQLDLAEVEKVRSERPGRRGARWAAMRTCGRWSSRSAPRWHSWAVRCCNGCSPPTSDTAGRGWTAAPATTPSSRATGTTGGHRAGAGHRAPRLLPSHELRELGLELLVTDADSNSRRRPNAR